MLQRLRFAGRQRMNMDYPLSEPFGLCMMSVLADCCAGETRARITDRGIAYATIANLAVENRSDRSVQTDNMISLTLSTLDLSDVPIANLIEFRKREARERSGHLLTEMRHNYLKKLEEHVDQITKKTNPRDVEELNRNFESDMKKDLANLNNEIRRAKVEAVFSKESIAALAAVAAVVAAPHVLPFAIPGLVSLAGPPIAAIGGTVSVTNRYGATRHSILQRHPMAYLYELNRSR